jgi:hypothetical protein
VFVIHSPPDRKPRMSGPTRQRFQPKMKKSADKEQEKRRASPTRSVPGVSVVYRFLRRSETLFVSPAKWR